MITKSELKELKALGEQHDVVKKLVDMFGSPTVDGYLAARAFFDMMNKQITEKAENGGEYSASDKDNKEYERHLAYIKQRPQLAKDLEADLSTIIKSEDLKAEAKSKSTSSAVHF